MLSNESNVELPSRETYGATLMLRSGLGWPDADCLRATVVYGTGVFVLWLAVYGGADWITRQHNYRVALDTPFDSDIPFIPATVLAYLSLYPMLCSAPFFLHTRQDLRAFAGALTVAILIAGIGFVFLPAQPIEVLYNETSVISQLYRFADRINLKYNYSPSLHVAMAVVCAASFSRSESTAVRTLFWLWAATIALSTLLTRQHYICDVLAGGVLGAAVVFRRPLHVVSTRSWTESH